jgi:hypothetical protein
LIENEQLTVCGVTIREVYAHWSPPVPLAPIVARLIEGVPAEYLIGLKTVVVTDAAGLNHEQRRQRTFSRGKKVPVRRCQGVYHQATRSEPAWIELFPDNINLCHDRFVLKLAILADIAIGQVFYHELGHHIHKAQAPEFGEREDIAENWRKRLIKPYLRKKYWYLTPVVYVLLPFHWVL